MQPFTFFTRLESFIFQKHLVWTINIILLSAIALISIRGTLQDLCMGMIVYLFLTPLFLVLKPKSIFSRNILFMSLYTFFTIPFTLNVFLSLGFNNSIPIPLALLSTFSTTILIFSLLYHYNKKNHRKEYLDHSKIALDIIRFVFVVILALTAIYGKINDDFSVFTRIVPIFKNNTGIDELRNSYQLTFQILAIPFVFSATLLRIVVDWLLLKK